MVLPTSSGATLLLLAAALLFGGLWANTLKMAGKWRFELYYFDFSVAFAVLGVVAAFTLGSFNSRELTFQDNLAIAGYRKIAYCLLAGAIFNLANMLLAGAISIAGLAVASTLSLGTAVFVGIIIARVSGMQGTATLELVGAAAVLGAVILAAYSHMARDEAAREVARNVALQPDPRDPRMKKKQAAIPGPARGIAIGIISGIVMAVSRPVLDMGRLGDDGVGPYGAAMLFGLGLLMSAFFMVPFFFNFPVAGRPLLMRDYFKSPAAKHLLGWLGGGLASAGAIASFVAWGAPRAAEAGATLSYALGNGGAVITALCGLLIWREFRESPDRTGTYSVGAILLFGLGVIMAAYAQV